MLGVRCGPGLSGVGELGGDGRDRGEGGIIQLSSQLAHLKYQVQLSGQRGHWRSGPETVGCRPAAVTNLTGFRAQAGLVGDPDDVGELLEPNIRYPPAHAYLVLPTQSSTRKALSATRPTSRFQASHD